MDTGGTLTGILHSTVFMNKQNHHPLIGSGEMMDTELPLNLENSFLLYEDTIYV